VPYDEDLAARIRAAIGDDPSLSERKMFGGIAFMVDGNMACGIVRSDIMVRVGPDAYEDALSRPHARPMDFTGRPMKGMVYVDGPGIADDARLREWVERGCAYAASLPAKR
jgi:TfoX/Sxy family transcriptional regulator of competence genes